MKVHWKTIEYLLLMVKDLSRIKFLGIEIHNQLGEAKCYELINYLN